MDIDHLALEIIDAVMEEQSQPETGFVIDSDDKAEWALRKIAGERAETQRYVNVCQTMIREYQEKIRQAEEKLQSGTSFLQEQLRRYFETVPHRSTKTLASYKLPSGTLKLKQPSPEYMRDEALLLKWLKENAYNDYIKVEEKANWAELKKKISVSGDAAVTEDGQIIEGVKIVEKPPVFEVET